MKDAQPKAIYLKDYQVPPFLIEQTKLNFDLQDGVTEVTSVLTMKRNPDSGQSNAPLVLDGQHLELKSLAVNGEAVAESNYTTDSESLTVNQVPDAFELTVVTHIKPHENTALEGLYKSSKMYCTQCEAEGFRRITYYLDRPDVMSIFETSIVADKAKFPVLL